MKSESYVLVFQHEGLTTQLPKPPKPVKTRKWSKWWVHSIALLLSKSFRRLL